jgi:hypothetical protein
MIQCFLSAINYGLRFGGGMSENSNVITYKDFSRYIVRLIFDLSYWFNINVIFLFIVFAIIVNTFACILY